MSVSQKRQEDQRKIALNILIRDGDWWLGESLSSTLEAEGHSVSTIPYDTETGHEEPTDSLVKGTDALVVFGYSQEASNPTQVIDHSTRQLYNLLHAASEIGVERCIYVSSLQLFQDYEENLTVTENWRSLPPTDDIALLACHLGEIVCKEFARDRRIKVATLRLGFPIVDGDLAAAEASRHSAAVSSKDAIQAITHTLSTDLPGQWQNTHVQSKVTNQRFLTNTAEQLLGIGT